MSIIPLPIDSNKTFASDKPGKIEDKIQDLEAILSALVLDTAISEELLGRVKEYGIENIEQTDIANIRQQIADARMEDIKTRNSINDHSSNEDSRIRLESVKSTIENVDKRISDLKKLHASILSGNPLNEPISGIDNSDPYLVQESIARAEVYKQDLTSMRHFWDKIENGSKVTYEIPDKSTIQNYLDKVKELTDHFINLTKEPSTKRDNKYNPFDLKDFNDRSVELDTLRSDIRKVIKDIKDEQWIDELKGVVRNELKNMPDKIDEQIETLNLLNTDLEKVIHKSMKRIFTSSEFKEKFPDIKIDENTKLEFPSISPLYEKALGKLIAPYGINISTMIPGITIINGEEKVDFNFSNLFRDNLAFNTAEMKEIDKISSKCFSSRAKLTELFKTEHMYNSLINSDETPYLIPILSTTGTSPIHSLLSEINIANERQANNYSNVKVEGLELEYLMNADKMLLELNVPLEINKRFDERITHSKKDFTGVHENLFNHILNLLPSHVLIDQNLMNTKTDGHKSLVDKITDLGKEGYLTEDEISFLLSRSKKTTINL